VDKAPKIVVTKKKYLGGKSGGGGQRGNLSNPGTGKLESASKGKGPQKRAKNRRGRFCGHESKQGPRLKPGGNGRPAQEREGQSEKNPKEPEASRKKPPTARNEVYFFLGGETMVTW